MTDDIDSQAILGPNYSGIMTSDIEYVHRVLHAILVRERLNGWDAYRVHREDSIQCPERFIVQDNREYGWATIALSGNEEEDVMAYVEGGDFAPDRWGFCHGARPLHGPRRRMGEPHPRVHLDRNGLELVLIARHIIHQSGVQIMDDLSGIIPRQWAVTQAQALLAADRLSALCLLADAADFRGEQWQKLKQLDWMLDGQEPGLVVCRHCIEPIDPSDPFLAVDTECEAERHQRTNRSLARYSAHAACYADNSSVKPGDHDHFWVDYPAESSWVILAKYRLRWADQECRLKESYRCLLAAEAAAFTGRAQSRNWNFLSEHQDDRPENSNDLILSLTVAEASARLEIKPGKHYAVVSFWTAETYPGYGAGFSNTEIPTAVLWRSITMQARTEVFGWSCPDNYSDLDAYYEAAACILTFAIDGDHVVITVESRSSGDQTSMTIPLATLRAALGEHQ